MKFTIITPAYNSQSTISDTMNSILSQTYDDVEHIIIDGGSTDNTLKIIENSGFDVKVYSESDNGIYDAMNKGIKKASGDIIGILNSDDLYFDSNVLQTVAEAFERNEVPCVYGDLVYVDKDNTSRIIRYWKSSPYKLGSFKKGWHPPHPSFFVRKKVYEKYGLFREDMRIAADFEFMLRILEKYQLPSFYIDRVLVKMRLGGESNRSIKNMIKGNRDYKRAFLVNGYKIPKFYTVRRLMPKLLQFMTATKEL